MSEIGIVKEINSEKNLLTIEFEARGACKNCGICLAGADKSISLMRVQALNTINAKIGDKIEFSVKDGETLKASMTLYGFPLGMFLLGFIIGSKLAEWLNISPDLFSLFVAAGFFGGAFYLLSLSEKKKKAEDRTHIELIRIL